MANFSVNRKIGVYAQSNYGKTWLIRELIKYYASNGVPVVVYDTDHMDLKYKFSAIKNCIVFQPAVGKEDDPQYLNKFLNVLKSKYSNFMVFIDDLDSFFDSNSALSFEFEALKSAASKGRHQRMGLIYASKMAAYIPTQLVQNTNLFYIGSFPTAKSIKSIDKIVSFDDIKKLDYQQHEFIEIDCEQNFAKRLVKA